MRFWLGSKHVSQEKSKWLSLNSKGDSHWQWNLSCLMKCMRTFGNRNCIFGIYFNYLFKFHSWCNRITHPFSFQAFSNIHNVSKRPPHSFEPKIYTNVFTFLLNTLYYLTLTCWSCQNKWNKPLWCAEFG